jgi:(S)-ureidoglycine aminohydrolase
MIETRGHRGRAYTLLTPDNHYASHLPNLPGASVFKLVTPRRAPARLAQYLVSIGEQAVTAEIAPGFENFFFALQGSGEVRWEDRRAELAARAYAYVPAPAALTLMAGPGARLLWLKRRYEPWPGLESPPGCSGRAQDVTAQETATAGLRRRELLEPTDPRFDFNMSLMSFEAGVGLPQIEIHDEEHGLYMTSGGGVYTLERDDHEVREGDFIYMAPYCPQGFAAGEAGAEYLLYKDVYRDGF